MSRGCEGQISLFEMLGNVIMPVPVADMTETYFEEAVLYGSGYTDGKKRIYELYQKDMSVSERTKAIKSEYGIGGAGWFVDGYGVHGYDTYHGGYRIEWSDEAGDHDKVFDWNHVEKVIHRLVDSGKYYQPPKVTPEWTCAFTTPVIDNGKPAFQTEDGQIVKLGDDKPICQFSGHVCNKQSLWEVADTLDDKDNCPHVCCRKCDIKHCGARCNGSEEPKNTCNDCIFNIDSYCAYNTRGCYCVDGDKQIKSDSGWKFVDKGKNLPPCTGNWQDYDVLVYYPKIDDYAYEVWEYKDWTFRGKDKYNADKGNGSIVAWKKKEVEILDFSRHIAEYLIEHCNEWKYDHIEKLKENKTVENFYRIFCKITKTYFVRIGTDHFNVEFSKDGIARIKKCGPDLDKQAVITVNIQDILEKLPSKGREQNQCLGEPCASCDVEWCSIKCFERRGYMWDRCRRFIKDENGNKLRKSIKDRECKVDYE